MSRHCSFKNIYSCLSISLRIDMAAEAESYLLLKLQNFPTTIHYYHQTSSINFLRSNISPRIHQRPNKTVYNTDLKETITIFPWTPWLATRTGVTLKRCSLWWHSSVYPAGSWLAKEFTSITNTYHLYWRANLLVIPSTWNAVKNRERLGYY